MSEVKHTIESNSAVNQELRENGPSNNLETTANTALNQASTLIREIFKKMDQQRPVAEQQQIINEVESAAQALETRIYEAVKSWWIYVHNTAKCYKCGYCILSSRSDLSENGVSGIDSFIDREIGDVPSKINQLLNKLPVSINNYFGDPGIQWNNTVKKLKNLEEVGHEGPVGIISKSYFSPDRANVLATSSCNVVVLQSISNLPESIEPVSHRKRIDSLKNLTAAGVPTIAYLRPLIPEYNTNLDIIRATLDSIAQSGCKIVCYSGLRGTEDVLELLEKNTGERPKPPQGHKKWQDEHKLVEGRVKDFIEMYAKQLGLTVFRKTSCAVSYTTDQNSDYNCHWAQAEKYGCAECPMASKCADTAENWDENKIDNALSVLGAKGKIVKEERKKACSLTDVCTKNCSSCPVSGGVKLKLEGKWSLGELSVARWLAGVPVVADEELNTARIFHALDSKETPAEKPPLAEHFYRKPNESACPQGCAYCIVDLNPERQKEYEDGVDYFMNSFVAINIPFRNREKHLKQLHNYNFDLVRGDTVGFQGASEPLMFPKELDFVCAKAREYNFRVAICTKADISPEKARGLFAKYGDILDVEVSYAKLTELERTDAKRLDTIKNLQDAGFNPLVVVQPFINGITDKRLDSLLAEIKEVGVKDVCVNGFRYNSSMEGWAKQVLPPEWLKKYQAHEGEEWLPNRQEVAEQIKASGLNYTKISDWLQNKKQKREIQPSADEIQLQIKKIVTLMRIPDSTQIKWQLSDNKILLSAPGIDKIKLRIASATNSECLAKTLSRRLCWPVILQ